MSTSVTELNANLLARQKEQIDRLMVTLEIAKRRIHNYEHTIESLRKERQDLYHSEIQTIKLTSDFLSKERQYLITIDDLSKENAKLKGMLGIPIANSDKNKEESKEQPSPQHTLHLTPSYSNIIKQQLNFSHITQHPYTGKKGLEALGENAYVKNQKPG